MIKLFVKKGLIVLLCIPFYPIIMFAAWYEKAKYYGPAFNLRKATSEYWAEVWEAITYRKEGR